MASKYVLCRIPLSIEQLFKGDCVLKTYLTKSLDILLNKKITF